MKVTRNSVSALLSIYFQNALEILRVKLSMLRKVMYGKDYIQLHLFALTLPTLSLMLFQDVSLRHCWNDLSRITPKLALMSKHFPPIFSCLQTYYKTFQFFYFVSSLRYTVQYFHSHTLLQKVFFKGESKQTQITPISFPLSYQK